MVSTPKSSNNKIASKMEQNEPNSKASIISSYQEFGHFIDPVSIESSKTKSGAYDSTFYNKWIDFLSENDVLHEENPVHDDSPLLTSSMKTPPSLILDGISTPHNLNNPPLFGTSFSANPSLEPNFDFFPLTDATSMRPYVIIPVTSPMTTIPNSISHALNIPWFTDTTNTSANNLQNMSSSSPPTVVSTTTSTSMTLPTKSTTTRRRSNCVVDKDPQLVTEIDEMAAERRAKNTKAARENRLRKLMKMNSLEQQVKDLKAANSDLQTRIAVLESQKKGLEEKNSERDVRVDILEQQLAKAHEILIKEA